ncbi:MAG: sigma-70 family RNA polymerase sigma factor, partial [Chloroflexi bacterium]
RSIPISDEMEASLPATGPLPEERVQLEEQTRRVQLGLQSLSAEHRAVLELVFYQGLSLKETAEVCGCPVGTVKSRLSYARRQLKDVLSRTEDIR